MHILQCMESGFLLAIAFDCCIAIFGPLRHTSLLTPSILDLTMVVAIQAVVLVGLLPILITRLSLFLSKKRLLNSVFILDTSWNRNLYLHIENEIYQTELKDK